MKISDIDQEVSDIDWFAIDSEYNVANLSSAGGRIPSSAASSIEDNALLVSFFQSLAAESKEFIINPDYQAPVDMHNPLISRIFFEHYAYYSVRGLFSFNRNETGTNGLWSDYEYSLITSPIKPLIYAHLPHTIQEIICKTKYNGIFSQSSILDLRNVS